MDNKNGSLTVEAALVLPIFICAVITIAFLVKAALVHEIIQHSIAETANELSTYSYVIAVSGVKKLDERIADGASEKAGEFNEHLNSYVDGYEAIKNFQGDIKGKLNTGGSMLNLGNLNDQAISQVRDNYDSLAGKVEEALKSGKEAFSKPKEEVTAMLFSMGEFAYDRSKGALIGEMSKLFIKKYLKTEKLPDADERLKALNVEGGFQGLDFSKSKLISDGKNIEIIVQYKLNLALPYNIMPDIFICQRAYSRAWMEGDELDAADGSKESGKDDKSNVWDLPKTKRGKEIQKKYYNKNTPEFFKTITRFDNGVATRVSSIDTRTLTYRKAANLKSVVKGDIDKLVEFDGDNRDGMEVRPQDITEKKLIVVVPKGEITPEQRKILDQCIAEAEARGIKMSVDEL